MATATTVLTVEDDRGGRAHIAAVLHCAGYAVE
jgi:hypothetical protein